jgi:uncharacterized protein
VVYCTTTIFVKIIEENQKKIMSPSIQKHSLLKSIILHLLPGILVGICYYAITPIVLLHGFPSVMALNLSGLFILLPFELGFLRYQKKKEGVSSLKGIMVYTKTLKSWQYLVYVFVIIVLSGIAFKVFSFTSDLLMPLLKQIPAEMQLNMGLNGEYLKSKLIITYALFLILVVIAIPIVEELYFRGYLLPRMPSKLKGWTVLIHSGLFALYHTFSPGLIIVRTLGVFPLVYMVKRKENIYIGMVAHCLGNSIDFVVGLLFILNM